MEAITKKHYEMKKKTHKEKDVEIRKLKDDVTLFRTRATDGRQELFELRKEFGEFKEIALKAKHETTQLNYSLNGKLKKCEAELSATQQVVKIERGDRLRAYEKTLTIIEKLVDNN